MRLRMVFMAAALCIPLAACGPDPVPPPPPPPPVVPITTTTTTTTTTAVPRFSPEQIEDAMDAFARKQYDPMAREIFEFWSAQYKQYGMHSQATGAPITSSVQIVYLSRKNPSFTCGTRNQPLPLDKDSALGPLYCLDGVDTVVFPLKMTRLLTAGQEVKLGDGTMQLSASQEVGVFFLLAHELAHNVQMELMGDAAMKAADEVAIENAADCKAGVAIAGVARTFSNKDVNTLLRMAEEIGVPPGGRHGTPQQRRDAVAYGMLNRPYNSPAVTRGLADCFQRYLPGAVRFG